MATIGGLSNAASNGVNMYGANVKGYGGLASGLDTDSLIEGMTIGTRTKIQEALKQKQNYQWEMDAYRSVSDQLVAFSNKYLNLTSSSSPYRASFFDKSMITPHGAFSKHLSVSGASGALDNMSVLGIKQLAKDSSLVTNRDGSIRALNTAGVKFGEDIDVSNLEGGQLTIKLDGYNYTINMNSGNDLFGAGAPDSNKTDFTTAENTANSINAMLKNTKVYGQTAGGVDTLADKVELLVVDEKFVLRQKGSNDMRIAGGSKEALELMGFMNDGDLVNDGLIPKDDTGLVGEMNVVLDDPLKTTHEFAEYMGGKTITFNYNGIAKKIKLPDEEGIKAWGNKDDKAAGMSAMAEYLKTELDAAFGRGKIFVNVPKDGSGNAILDAAGNPSLSFTTEDSSSILRITAADEGIMSQKGVFGISYSTTNRLNIESALAKSGLSGLPGEIDASGNPMVPGRAFGDFTYDADGKKVYAVTKFNDAEGNLFISINGKTIPADTVDEDGNPVPGTPLTVESSLKQIIMAINDSDAGVKISYNETADRFSLVSTNHGEAGEIIIDPSTSPTDNFLQALIGATPDEYTYIPGQDAIMTVRYEGNLETDIKRDSNTFKLEGSTFTLNSTFGYAGEMVDHDTGNRVTLFDREKKPITQQVTIGNDGMPVPRVYDADGNPMPSGLFDADGNLNIPWQPAGKVLYDYRTDIRAEGTEPITFTSAVDTEKVTKIIGTMVEDYNVMADLISKLTGTKPDRKYGPLTDDEKAQLNAEQIKQLEDKAKEGVLFNDPLLRSLAEKMRSVFSGTADVGTLSGIGLTLSNSWKDNGKVSFDEEKFKNALLEDSEKVKKIFTEPATLNSQGQIEKAGGISVRLKAIADDFAGVNAYRKGSLIEKAGSIAAPTSVLQNSLKKLMDNLDEDIDRLKDKLKIEVDRYSKQFSSLEQMISQMNSQSSWFSQAMGG